MNVKQALEVPVTRVLEILNCKSKPRKGKQQFFYSPFREEKTPSFHVHCDKNTWYDFGEGKGGNVIDLVSHHLKTSHESDTLVDALRWLRNMTGNYQPIQIPKIERNEAPVRSLTVRQNAQIQHQGLLRYIANRGISLSIALKYTRQLYIHNSQSGQNFYAIGLQNENRGWELRNPSFKACISPKAVTFIRGSEIKSNQIHVFEGFFDFLSLVERSGSKQLKGDSLILNSLSCMEKGLAYLKNYGYEYLYSYMDNDEAGQKAIQRLNEFVATEEGLVHKPMNEKYAPLKDVNAWHMHELGLVL